MKAAAVVCMCGHSRRWHRGDRGHCTRRRCSCVVIRPREPKAPSRLPDGEMEWAVERIHRAIIGTMADDFGAVADVILELAQRSDATWYGAVCAFAATVRDPRAPQRPPESWFEVLDAQTGDQVVSEADDPERRRAFWLGRFLTAAANDDHDTQFALWGSIPVDEKIDRTCDLVRFAASMVKAYGAEASS